MAPQVPLSSKGRGARTNQAEMVVKKTFQHRDLTKRNERFTIGLVHRLLSSGIFAQHIWLLRGTAIVSHYLFLHLTRGCLRGSAHALRASRFQVNSLQWGPVGILLANIFVSACKNSRKNHLKGAHSLWFCAQIMQNQAVLFVFLRDFY
jgi:hypothetical protein